MSKHSIEIDFDNLEFNLYDLLNISNTASLRKIKKSYRRIIIKFHPDKNSKIEENIYYHLTIANQVLTNIKLKNKYDNWLKDNNESKSHNKLKESFNYIIPEQNNISTEKLNIKKEQAQNNFKLKAKALDIKHGVHPNDNVKIMDKYQTKSIKREDNLGIINEKFKNTNKFNTVFQNRKSTGKFNNQLIKSNTNLSFYQVGIGQNYASINDYNSLYVEDSIQTNSFSSLDRAFSLHPKIKQKDVDIKDRMEKYQQETSELQNLKSSQYVKKKYTEWNK